MSGRQRGRGRSRGRSRNGDAEQARERQYQRKLNQQGASAGQKLQSEQLRGMLQNPDVLETLLDPQSSEDRELQQIDKLVEPHLHRDEVLSILSNRDIYSKSWDSKLTETKLRMSFPADEARSPDRRVERVKGRVHGHTRRPLKPREKQYIEARMKQKADRARRAAGGRLQELLLSQVVDVGEQRDDDGGGGLLPSWLGGGE